MLIRFRLIPLHIATLALLGSSAVAIPAIAKDSPSTTTAIAQDSDGDGTLDAADTVSAAAAAAAEGKPVEDLSRRTENASTYVNPSGSFTERDFGGAVRIKRGGDWRPVDYTLKKAPDGSYAPAASDLDIRINGGSSKEAARVTFADGESLAVTWPENLPEPKINGGVATYKLSDATDLVVAVTSGGLNARIRLHQQPDEDDPIFTLGLRAEGVELNQKAGKLEIYDEEGKVVAKTSRLIAWDATTDAAGDPANVVNLAASLDETATHGDVTKHTLDLATPSGFLSNPDTKYPVIIDPDISMERTRDTWVRSGDSASHGSDYRLIVGKINPDGTNNPGPTRSYLKFYNNSIRNNPNIEIVSATLGLYQYYGYSCTDRRMYVYPVGVNWADSITWANKPAAVSGNGATNISKNRGASGCGSGWTKINLTKMAKAWAAGSVDMQGVRLHAGDESYSSFERRFCSMNPDSSISACGVASRRPYLDVTYNRYPSTPTTPTASVSGSAVSFSSMVSDPDGGAVRARFVVTKAGNTVLDTHSPFVSSGTTATKQIAHMSNGTYVVRAWAKDARVQSKSASATRTFTINSSTGFDFDGFFGISHTRVVDTTTGIGGPTGTFTPGATRTVEVAGTSDIPEDTSAIFANISIKHSGTAGNLQIGASDASALDSLSYGGVGVSNHGRPIRLGADGRIKITSPAGSPPVDIKVDIQGYFTDNAEDSVFSPIPTRLIVDTSTTSALAPGEERDIPIDNLGIDLDDAGVDALALTVEARNWQHSGAIAVFDPDADLSETANVSFVGSGTSVTSKSMIDLSLDNSIRLKNTSAGSVDVVVSATGYWAPNFSDAEYDFDTDDSPVDVEFSEDPAVQQLLELQPAATEDDVVTAIQEITTEAGLTGSEQAVAEGLVEELTADDDDGEYIEEEIDLDEEEEPTGQSMLQRSSSGSPKVKRKLVSAKKGGDIFYSPSYSSRYNHGHTGLYTSKAWVVQATGPESVVERVRAKDINVWKGKSRIMRVVDENKKPLSKKQVKKAVKWALSRRGDLYNGVWVSNARIVSGKPGSKSSKQNCSQLVWAAYKHKLDIDFNHVEWNIPSLMLADKALIKPGEIRDSKFTKIYKKL